MTDQMKRIDALQVGDLVDLEGDKYADPRHDNPVLDCEYQIVESIERETPECIAVVFENFDMVGFPPDHLVKVGQRHADGCRCAECADLDGTSGQDRESYSDDQDRESYTVRFAKTTALSPPHQAECCGFTSCGYYTPGAPATRCMAEISTNFSPLLCGKRRESSNG